MSKLSRLVDGEWVEHFHPPVFREPAEDDEYRRVVATVPVSDPDVFLRLASSLTEPLHLLYVLHVSRGEAQPGRYESPPISLPEFAGFVEAFADYLSGDSRFDLWAHSPHDNATVVWDRHDLIYAYGPVQAYVSTLRAMGFSPGDPAIPGPHGHRYLPEFDEAAGRLMNDFNWHYSPLQPEDEM